MYTLTIVDATVRLLTHLFIVLVICAGWVGWIAYVTRNDAKQAKKSIDEHQNGYDTTKFKNLNKRKP